MTIKVVNGDGSLRDLGARNKRHSREKSNHPRGHRWRILRAYILNRDPICQVCKNQASQQVDHIKPIHLGGDDSHTNLQGICEQCHKEKSADEMTHRRSVQHPARRIDNIIP